MQLIIQLENGQPVGNPILKSNFELCFPGIDLSSLPTENYAEFIVTDPPEFLLDNQQITGTFYEYSNGVVYQRWVLETIN